MKPIHYPRLYTAVIGLLVTFAVMVALTFCTSCQTTRPPADPLAVAAPVDTVAAPPVNLPRKADEQVAKLPATGFFLTTPQGQQRRQARRDLKAQSEATARIQAAGVPRVVKVKDGAFSWEGDATAIAKKSTAIVKSDSATQNTLSGSGNLAHGDGITQTKQDTTKEAPGPLAVIADNLTGPLGIVLALAATGCIVVFLIRRKAAKTIIS